MITKFDDLCNEQQINPLDPTDDDLNKLINWCESTISTDLHLQGNLQDRFDYYKALATGFLTNFQPNIKADKLTEPVALFDNMTALQVIVYAGLDIYLKALHPSPKEVNTKIGEINLLHLSAVRGNLHTIEALLSLGAKPLENILFASLMLPINHDEDMIKNKQAIYVLLSNLAKNLLQERNESGDTILHAMAVYGYKKLIEDTLVHSKELASISNNATRYPIHSAILNSQDECVKVLAAVPGVEKLTDSKGRNALHYAAKYDDKNMVAICLHTPIAKDSIDKRRQTPLMLATIANNHSAIRELIDFGVQVNLTDDARRSALHYAVEANNLASVELLLAVPGINVNLSDDNSAYPLDLIDPGTPVGDKISELLIEQGAVLAPKKSTPRIDS